MTSTKITCYTCGNRYGYIGRGTHKGACPDCGSQLVSLSGTTSVEHVEVVDSGRYVDSDGGESEVPMELTEQEVFVFNIKDQTQRQIRLSIRVDWSDKTAVPTTFTTEDGHVHAADSDWDSDLVPRQLVETLDRHDLSLKTSRERIQDGI